MSKQRKRPIRRRCKLAKLVETDNQELYRPGVDDCKKWFNILNRVLFEQTLPPISEIEIRPLRKAWAYYEYFDNSNQNKIAMHDRYRSKIFFVEVLAHEMVHHYQYTYGQALGHGPSFRKWREKFSKKGLSLAKSYGKKCKK